MFKETAPEELERIAQGTRVLHVGRGETLFNRGDSCEGFHLVAYGQVKLAITSPQGAEKVVEIIGPGMSFGEAVMFLERPYPVYAQTLSDSLLAAREQERGVFRNRVQSPFLAPASGGVEPPAAWPDKRRVKPIRCVRALSA